MVEFSDRSMSLSAIVQRYPVVSGNLHDASLLFSSMPLTYSNSSWAVEEVATLADNVVFVLPLLDISLPLPTSGELLDCDQLWCSLRGKSKMNTTPEDTTFELVCDVVGGALLAKDKHAEGQTGITFKDVQRVLVPCGWLLTETRDGGLYKAAAGAPSSGKEGVGGAILNPAQARGRDLDGRMWDTDDKWGAQTKLQKLMVLTHLLPANKMEKFVYQLNFDTPLLQRTCLTLKASGDEHKDEAHQTRACTCS
jgi:hypothetical protein